MSSTKRATENTYFRFSPGKISYVVIISKGWGSLPFSGGKFYYEKIIAAIFPVCVCVCVYVCARARGGRGNYNV